RPRVSAAGMMPERNAKPNHLLATPRAASGETGRDEIPGDDRASPEHRDEGADREEGTVRDRELRVCAARDHDRDSDHRADERGEQQGQEDPLPAEERADHREELDVPSAHALAPRRALVAPGDGEEDAAAEQRPE